MQPDEKLIIWLGRIEPIKNIEALVSALGELRQLPWHLVIMGPQESPGYVAGLQRMVTDLGIAPRVHFLPPAYGDEKWAALADADFLALVSHSESWGNVAAEAVAAGVPVLVTETCGFASAMHNRGGLVVEKSVSAIRTGLHRLITDRQLYADCKATLPTLAAELTWEASVKKLAMVFEGWSDQQSIIRV